MSNTENTQRIELVGGILLVAAAVLAMLLANSPWAHLYDRLLDVHFEVRLGDAALSKPMLLWINDGMMAVFFLLVGLELKRDLIEGDLADRRRLILPAAAALGGIALPVAIYLLCNVDDVVRAEGWAIPAATDIAFAMGMLALLGKRVAPALRTFLLSLAVIDDIVAILIIAVYYTDKISWGARGLALAVVALLILLNRLKVTRYGVYLMIGVVLWLCVLKSGIHATLAGVVLGVTIPRRPKNSLGHSPLGQLEHVLRPWVAFVILPVFAFVNAGVSLAGVGMDSLTHTVTLGIGLGLVVGKPLGVFGTAWLLARLGWAKYPEGVETRHLLGVSALAGIGFTMSLFIGVLAFENAPRDFAVPIRVGVLCGSAVSAALGVLLLHTSLPRRS